MNCKLAKFVQIIFFYIYYISGGFFFKKKIISFTLYIGFIYKYIPFNL